MQLAWLKWFRTVLFCLVISTTLLVRVLSVSAQGEDVASSPKKPWGEFTIVEEKEGSPWWADVLLWVPNRALDAWDIFRVDVGAGPALGGVIRISKYAQAGYRRIAPASVRLGAFGRQAPALVEKSDEYGIGPGYVNSKERSVCAAEVGAGADLFLVSGYLGICGEEVVDFLAGIFFLDVSNDDIS